MTFFSGFAVYFIVWWMTFFVILPLGVRTQEEVGDVTLGTTESAPHAAQLWRKLLLTTLASGVIFGVYFLATSVFGMSFDSIPRVVPRFN